eukprot:2101841-Amphidinium_carterae.1
MKALNRIDKAHFKRLTETLNAGVYNIHCEKSYLSVRAVGQMVPVHVPLRPPEPLSLGELVSLVHVLLAWVEPESYSHKSDKTKAGHKDDKDCYAAAQQPGAEASREPEGIAAVDDGQPRPRS